MKGRGDYIDRIDRSDGHANAPQIEAWELGIMRRMGGDGVGCCEGEGRVV